MNKKPTYQPLWIPVVLAAAVIVGMFFGLRFPNNNKVAENDRKLNAILNLIAQNYVDTTNLNDLIELSIPEILGYLDPHTTYFTAEDLQAANDDLNGSFSGIGISFVMVNDTIGVVEVISGGPSEKVGLMAGDKIVTIDDSVATGSTMTNSEVMKRLRGSKGSKVKLGIKRQNTAKTLTFTVTRGDIPVNSVDAYYMIDKTTGYVKVNQFGRQTYDEFITAMASLNEEKLMEAKKGKKLKDLIGQEFYGEYLAKTDPLGANVPNPVSHVAYGYATQMCILDPKTRKIEKFVAAHDVGKAVNPLSVEGQIEGGVVMSMGYALTEQYPIDENCKPIEKYGSLGLFRAHEIPEIKAIVVDKPGLKVAGGAIGIGEITSIPTAPAIADAYYRLDGVRSFELPIKGNPYERKRDK